MTTPSSISGGDTVTNVKVTNVVAERGIKLVQDSANSVTKSEPQMWSLLQLVEKHRHADPEFKKLSLAKLSVEWIVRVTL